MVYAKYMFNYGMCFLLGFILPYAKFGLGVLIISKKRPRRSIATA